MAKNKISEYSSTSANNTDIANINIAEGCSPANLNNAIRTVMAQLKDFQTGSAGDSLTVGGNLDVSGTLAVTGATTLTGLLTGVNLTTTGNTTLGNASGDTLTITSLAVTTPNGLNFDSNTLVIDATNNRVGIAKATPTTALDVTGTVTATSFSGNISGTLTGSATIDGTLAVTGALTLDGAAGTSGQVLLSAGSGNTPTWGSAFIAGMIMLWSGSSATIPSGWLLCNGANGTPDLRNRFVVGATSTYAVGATGGSADAIVVSHTHTATVNDSGHSHSIADARGGSANFQGAYLQGADLAGPGTNTNTATTGISVSNSTTGSSGTNANLPPYYALCYIMKS
jgi:hypothetical protein